MAYKGPHGTKVNLDKAYTERKFKLFTTIEVNGSTASGEFMFARANGAIDQGAICRISLADGDADEVTTAESASTPNVLGVAMATLADNEFGWFWRGKGFCEALVATAISAGDALTTTANAGELGAGGDTVVTLGAIDANASGSTALSTVKAYGLLGTN